MTAVKADVIKIGLPPVARRDARLFILGSLPGEASLTSRRYYAHPTNQFWRLLGNAIDEDLLSLDYEDRLARLGSRQIGLWDVIASANRSGSLDQAIRSPTHNPLVRLLRHYPAVQAVAFNGRTAASAGQKLLSALPGLILVNLPSSSAANTRPFDEKADAWKILAKFAGPGPLPRA